MSAFEVHEHCFIRGPRANRTGSGWPPGTGQQFAHSHEGGDVPHTHPDCGPACYMISRNGWLTAGGIRPGKRKLTRRPTGEQFPLIETDAPVFAVIIGDPPAPPGWVGTGGGMFAAERMIVAFQAKAIVVPFPKRGDRA
jgi:hypothetical protein